MKLLKMILVLLVIIYDVLAIFQVISLCGGVYFFSHLILNIIIMIIFVLIMIVVTIILIKRFKDEYGDKDK